MGVTGMPRSMFRQPRLPLRRCDLALALPLSPNLSVPVRLPVVCSGRLLSDILHCVRCATKLSMLIVALKMAATMSIVLIRISRY